MLIKVAVILSGKFHILFLVIYMLKQRLKWA